MNVIFFGFWYYYWILGEDVVNIIDILDSGCWFVFIFWNFCNGVVKDILEEEKFVIEFFENVLLYRDGVCLKGLVFVCKLMSMIV